MLLMKSLGVFTCEPFFRTDAVFARCEKAGPAVLKHPSFESAHPGFVCSTEAHISYNYPSQVKELGIWSIVGPMALSADLFIHSLFYQVKNSLRLKSLLQE